MDDGVTPRPGFEVVFDTATDTKVDGIYDWREQGLVIVVTDGSVFAIDMSAGTMSDVTSAYTDLDPVGTAPSRVTFANYGEYLFMANGRRANMLATTQSSVGGSTGNRYTCKRNHVSTAATAPETGASWSSYWTDTGDPAIGIPAWASGETYTSGTADQLSVRSDGGTPPENITHIATTDKYILGLESDTERVWLSVVTDPLIWDADWFSAEYLPDDANCMLAVDGDLWVGGSRSIESFVNDGQTPFVRSSYGPISNGVLAPYSFLYAPELSTFIWIDDTRRLVTLNGRTPKPLNHSFDTWLKTLDTISDAVADYVVIGGTPYYILQFLSEEIAVSINLMNGSFSEFTWDVTAITNVPEYNLIYAGIGSSGEVASIDQSLNLDDTASIPAIIRTPRLQAQATTVVSELILHFKKLLTAASAGNATIKVKYRVDGGDWGTEQTITLTDNSKTDAVKHLYALGSYRYYCQYQFDLSGLHPYALVRAEQL